MPGNCQNQGCKLSFAQEPKAAGACEGDRRRSAFASMSCRLSSAQKLLRANVRMCRYLTAR